MKARRQGSRWQRVIGSTIAGAVAFSTVAALAQESVQSEERSFVNAGLHCGFVLLSGQTVHQRYPNAAETAPGFWSVDDGTLDVSINLSEASCDVVDSSVPSGRARDLALAVLHGLRVVDPVETELGRVTPAYQGHFNDRWVLLGYQDGPGGGSEFPLRVQH